MTQQQDRASILPEPSRRPYVAALKRVFEFWVMDRDFHDGYLADPEGTLAKMGLDVDPDAVALVLLRTLPQGAMGWDDTDHLPETFTWYRDYLEDRGRRSVLLRMREMPDDRRFHDWVERQALRCDRQMGSRGRLVAHLPLAFELTSGCSVGCPFCAFSAGRLKGLFRHTNENAQLWRDVLAAAHEVIGDAAGRAPCYYATEPLDNPDYECFLKDFHAEFGRVPQTTTAAATRDLKRTRDLLSWGQQAFEHFDRISVLSKAEFDELVAFFSPEELISTDLLPQFREAPIQHFVNAGRNRDAQDAGDTIACVSGFVVNMHERSVRLVAPVPSSDEHPTGELIFGKESFNDGASFKDVLLGMIGRHMRETIGLADILAR